MKCHPILFNTEMVRAVLDGRKTQTRRVVNTHLKNCTCKYGQPGDRLYVRERILRGYRGDMNMSRYMADDSPTVADAWPWKRDHLPAIHCPRGLSRILLEITKVRMERVRDISDRDAMREGSEQRGDNDGAFVAGFELLWNSINAKRGYGWEVNPFVWVIEFRKIMP